MCLMIWLRNIYLNYGICAGKIIRIFGVFFLDTTYSDIFGPRIIVFLSHFLIDICGYNGLYA